MPLSKIDHLPLKQAGKPQNCARGLKTRRRTEHCNMKHVPFIIAHADDTHRRTHKRPSDTHRASQHCWATAVQLLLGCRCLLTDLTLAPKTTKRRRNKTSALSLTADCHVASSHPILIVELSNYPSAKHHAHQPFVPFLLLPVVLVVLGLHERLRGGELRRLLFVLRFLRVCKTRQDKTRQDKTRQDKTRQDVCAKTVSHLRSVHWRVLLLCPCPEPASAQTVIGFHAKEILLGNKEKGSGIRTSSSAALAAAPPPLALLAPPEAERGAASCFRFAPPAAAAPAPPEKRLLLLLVPDAPPWPLAVEELPEAVPSASPKRTSPQVLTADSFRRGFRIYASFESLGCLMDYHNTIRWSDHHDDIIMI